MNTTISDENGVSFHCDCQKGYTSIHCELKIDVCANITCANRGICENINMSWKCICLDTTLYYGDHCQYRTNSLKIKQALSRSSASIAITIISFTCSFVIFMDILTYFFHIDLVKIERIQWQQAKEEEKRRNSNVPIVAVRFQYVP